MIVCSVCAGEGAPPPEGAKQSGMNKKWRLAKVRRFEAIRRGSEIVNVTKRTVIFGSCFVRSGVFFAVVHSVSSSNEIEDQKRNKIRILIFSLLQKDKRDAHKVEAAERITIVLLRA